VQPGSASASEIGIPSVEPETVATRAGRALRVALLTCPEASAHLDRDAVQLVAADDFTLGVAATRVEVALRGEGLTAIVTRLPAPDLTMGKEPTDRPSARIVFRQK
jgi:hypothetical protein